MLLSIKLTFFTYFITFTYAEWIPLFKIAYIYDMVYYSLQEWLYEVLIALNVGVSRPEIGLH